MRENFTENSQVQSLKKIFEELDSNSDGGITQQEFIKGMQQMNLGLTLNQLSEVFAVLDVSSDGEIEYDEFLSALKPSNLQYGYDLEDALLQLCDVVDLVIILFDPKMMRFNVREMTIYKEMYEIHKVKMHVCCFLQDKHVIDKDGMERYLKDARDQLSTRCRDTTLKTLPCLWTPKSVAAGRTPQSIKNHLNTLISAIGDHVDGVLDETMITPTSKTIDRMIAVFLSSSAPNMPPSFSVSLSQTHTHTHAQTLSLTHTHTLSLKPKPWTLNPTSSAPDTPESTH